MEVTIGKSAGFCGGVINSVIKSEKLLNEYENIYCLGELVHNKHVVDKLKTMGLKVVSSIDEVEDGNKVIIRAHGVAKEVYELAKRKNIQLFDLTCPKVLKIHEEASKLNKEGYFIILVAQKDHPEAIGTISFCGNECTILENEKQLDNVVDMIKSLKNDKVAVISQTTFSVDKFNYLVDRIKLLLKDYEVCVNNTICSATELRQKETKELAVESDAMIIIGGKNSSNTRKLYDIALEYCKNTFIIESINELNQDMSIYDKISIMAGASTPKSSIDEVVAYIDKLGVKNEEIIND